MKILHLNTFSRAGGAETIAYSLFNFQPGGSLYVKKNNLPDDRIIEAPENAFDKLFFFLDKVLWRLGIKKRFKNLFFLDEVLNGTYSKLRDLPAYRDADIIHLHNLHGGYFDLSALRRIGLEKKIVWTLHDMWCMTGGEAYTFGNENFKKGIAQTPYLAFPPLNGPLIDRRQHYLEQKRRIYRQIAGNITFVPVSRWLEACLTSAYVWDSSLTEVMIHNGVETDIFHTSGRPEHNGAPRVLLFNSDNIFKGHSIYPEVLESVSHPFELNVIGKLLHIRNPNMVYCQQWPVINERHKLADIYRQADILIFPSLADNLPLVPLEAMACGVCVFASDTGGIPEIIEHGESGFLFDSAKSLGVLLHQMLPDPALTALIGQQAARTVSESWSLPHMASNYERLYRSILGK